MTIDRASGLGLAVVALLVLEETRRLALPLGSLANPGPAYFPGVLAALLLIAAVAIVVLGGRAAPLAGVAWSEWRHGVAIFAVLAFGALALERLGYRLTIFLMVVFLVGVIERRHPVAALVFALALSTGTFWLFETILRVPLPRGPLVF